ncbi:ETC complex I subunit [Minwuia sp.]|uniref:ETC complex I subunit n=1 Tax=Minwuia sp. TaxID=2493630 RepID=UPI003A941567
MSARIFRPAKTAMQSGKAATRKWRLEFRADTARHPDPLMGWTSLADTQSQVRLNFDTKEEALAYAEKHGIDAKVFEPRERPLKLRAYSDNFAYNRVI